MIWARICWCFLHRNSRVAYGLPILLPYGKAGCRAEQRAFQNGFCSALHAACGRGRSRPWFCVTPKPGQKRKPRQTRKRLQSPFCKPPGLYRDTASLHMLLASLCSFRKRIAHALTGEPDLQILLFPVLKPATFQCAVNSLPLCE